ncbi:hypothetical protein ABZP36_008283 [Zizania latifolia]
MSSSTSVFRRRREPSGGWRGRAGRWQRERRHVGGVGQTLSFGQAYKMRHRNLRHARRWVFQIASILVFTLSQTSNNSTESLR